MKKAGENDKNETAVSAYQKNITGFELNT